MKTFITLFTALLLTINVNTLIAQSTPTSILAEAELDGWKTTENWVQAYQDNIDRNGSLSWMGDIMGDGATLLTHANTEGLILVLETENEDDLSMAELAEASLITSNGTRVYPISTAEQRSSGATAHLQGELNGQPVRMQRICMQAPESDQIITVLSILPANIQNDQHAFATAEVVATNLLPSAHNLTSLNP